MKRSVIGIVILVLIGIVWAVVIEHINTRKTVLDVQMSGNLDEVRFYKTAGTDKPLVILQVNGNAMSQFVELPNADRVLFGLQSAPAQYYFVATKAGQSYKSPPICCETGFADKKGTLTIRGLNDWEISDQ
jgi:hypothetical protein